MNYFKDSEFHQMIARKEREDDVLFQKTFVEETEEEFKARMVKLGRGVFFYFAFVDEDPVQTTYSEMEWSIEELRERFVGTWVKTGDEEHDVSRVCDIWTEAQAKAYFAEGEK